MAYTAELQDFSKPSGVLYIESVRYSGLFRRPGGVFCTPIAGQVL